MTAELLDNMVWKNENKHLFLHDIEILRDKFANYLSVQNRIMAEQLRRVKPTSTKLKWKSDKNMVDCGSISIWHMEAYMGKGKWNDAINTTNEGQMKKLRARIAYRLLTHVKNIRWDDDYMIVKQFYAKSGNNFVLQLER